MERILATVAERIKSARERAGLSRGELARMSGLSRTGVYFIENAIHIPTRRTVERIAIALRVNVRELWRKP